MRGLASVNTRSFGSKSSLQVLPRGVSTTALMQRWSDHVGSFSSFVISATA